MPPQGRGLRSTGCAGLALSPSLTKEKRMVVQLIATKLQNTRIQSLIHSGELKGSLTSYLQANK